MVLPLSARFSEYISKNKDEVTKKLHIFAKKKTINDIVSKWSKKVIQYQYSLYNDKSNADFPLLFDTAIADALVLGPLRTEEISLSEEQIYRIKSYMTDIKTEKLMIAIAQYYIANHEHDSDYVILSKTNISAYLGSASYMDTYGKQIPEGFMIKKPENNGVSAVKVNI